MACGESAVPSVFEAAAHRAACVENGQTLVSRPLHFTSPSVRREGAFDDVVRNAEQEVNGEQRADFTDAVVVIEHQPTTLRKVRHHMVKDIVDLRMLYPFSLARALEVLLKLYFFIIQLTLLGYLPSTSIVKPFSDSRCIDG